MNTRPQPSLSLLLSIPCLAILFTLLTHFRNIDIDVFHEMALARETFRTGHFPYHDFASFTSTVDPVIHHEWLTGFIFYAVATTTGPTGFMLFKYLLVALLVALLTRTAFRRGATAATFCLLAPMAMVVGGAGLGTIRAQIFTLILSAALLTLLEHARPPLRHSPFGFRHFLLLLWLPLQLLWINLHAGFVVGLGILLLTLTENLLRKIFAPSPSPPITNYQ